MIINLLEASRELKKKEAASKPPPSEKESLKDFLESLIYIPMPGSCLSLEPLPTPPKS